MDKYKYLNRYTELVQIADEKEAETEAFIQKWLDGESVFSIDVIDQSVTKVRDQIVQLRAEAQKNILEFERISKEEKLEKEKLQSSNAAKMRLRDKLGVEASSIVITGGVLSSDASESHLIGREKTPEEINLDKQVAISTLREKVVKKEISLTQASQLKNDIEKAYTIENSTGKHM